VYVERNMSSEPVSPDVSPHTTTIVERVQPAPQRQPVPQPQRPQDTPPIQVSIGTIDLRVNPPEPPKPQPRPRRRKPQGFDSFRQRRGYAGWEE
jgi:hypothetical protein